ncbi:MAG: hypothetical protein N2450_06210 [bacterium]|nr:hypothetical protein [bacterium]
MSLQIVPYEPEHIPMVKAFNQRLLQFTNEYHFPESPVSTWLPKVEERTLYEQMYLVLENQMVRGGYILKYQDFYLNDTLIPIIDFKSPISEGIINSTYSMLGLLMLKDAMNKEPMMYGLGMGGWNVPIVRLLKALKWYLCEIPFYFHVIHPFQFLRGIEFLRKDLKKRVLLDGLAYTGIGAIGSHLLFTFQRLKYQDETVSLKEIHYEKVHDWEDWANEIWEQGKTNYRCTAVRNQTVLEILYPKDNSRFHKILIRKKNEPVGWAVLIISTMKNHKQFGNLRVGTIVDCFAKQKCEGYVIQCATKYIRNQHADLIVSNQLHQDWVIALQKCGFIKGPSNFLFTASPELTRALQPMDKNIFRCHFNRGDGDGPIHL